MGPLLDSDVLIDFFRGQAQAVDLVGSLEEFCVSTISVTELHSGAKNEAEVKRLDSFFSDVQVIPTDLPIARLAGALCHQYRRSHGVQLPDATVAAAAIQTGAKLLTLNVKHYPMIDKLKPAYIKK